jgi:hypothetical protein
MHTLQSSSLLRRRKVKTLERFLCDHAFQIKVFRSVHTQLDFNFFLARTASQVLCISSVASNFHGVVISFGCPYTFKCSTSALNLHANKIKCVGALWRVFCLPVVAPAFVSMRVAFEHRETTTRGLSVAK